MSLNFRHGYNEIITAYRLIFIKITICKMSLEQNKVNFTAIKVLMDFRLKNLEYCKIKYINKYIYISH